MNIPGTPVRNDEVAICRTQTVGRVELQGDPAPGGIRRFNPKLLLVFWISLVSAQLSSIAPSSAAADLTSIKTVFIILLENHDWSTIKGSANCPYINNSLLPIAYYSGLLTTAPGIHPSEPNYLWLEAGTNFGIFHDSDPAHDHQASTNHLVTLLKNAGISWRAYQEDISGLDCPVANTAGYAVRHDPFVYFDD